MQSYHGWKQADLRRECVRLGISLRRGKVLLTAEEMRSELASVQRMGLGAFMARVSGPGVAAERTSNGLAADAVLLGEGARSAVGDGAGQDASRDVRVRGCAGKHTLRGKYAPNRKERLQVLKLKKRGQDKYKSELKQRLREKYESELSQGLKEKYENELKFTLRGEDVSKLKGRLRVMYALRLQRVLKGKYASNLKGRLWEKYVSRLKERLQAKYKSELKQGLARLQEKELQDTLREM